MSVQIRKSLSLCQAELLGLLVLQAVISWLVESWPWAGGGCGSWGGEQPGAVPCQQSASPSHLRPVGLMSVCHILLLTAQVRGGLSSELGFTGCSSGPRKQIILGCLKKHQHHIDKRLLLWRASFLHKSWTSEPRVIGHYIVLQAICDSQKLPCILGKGRPSSHLLYELDVLPASWSWGLQHAFGCICSTT